MEASSAYRGIGLVKLMGRQSGFIAMQASMASGVVDIVSRVRSCGGLLAGLCVVKHLPAGSVGAASQQTAPAFPPPCPPRSLAPVSASFLRSPSG